MDSLKGSHTGLENVFQSYLCEEWKERHKSMVDDVCSRLLHLQFISPELPQQENLYDCGLFLLHYVELFLMNAPISFSPFQIMKFSDFLTSNWFHPAEASLKRVHIQKLIYDIFEDSSHEAPATDCINKRSPSRVHSNRKRFHLTMREENSTCSIAEPKTAILLSTTCPVRAASCFSEPGLVSKDEEGAIVNSSSANCSQMETSHQRGFMSLIEENEEAAVSLLDSRTINFSEPGEGRSHSRVSTRLSLNLISTQPHEDWLPEKVGASGLRDDVSVKSSCFQGNASPETHLNFDSVQDINLEDDNSVSKEENAYESDDEECAKRRKLVHGGGERLVTMDLFK